MKSNKIIAPKQDRTRKLKNAIRRKKFLMKHLTNQLSTVTEHEVIKMILQKIETEHRQCLVIQEKLEVLK